MLEYMEGGDLTSILVAQQGDFSEDFCKWNLYQLALALKKMHQSNILHRDIKAANILCRENGDIKLADLGVSTYIA